jgi:hypothetical protein
VSLAVDAEWVQCKSIPCPQVRSDILPVAGTSDIWAANSYRIEFRIPVRCNVFLISIVTCPVTHCIGNALHPLHPAGLRAPAGGTCCPPHFRSSGSAECGQLACLSILLSEVHSLLPKANSQEWGGASGSWEGTSSHRISEHVLRYSVRGEPSHPARARRVLHVPI